MSGSGGLVQVKKPQRSTELLTCRVGKQWLGLQVRQVREVVTPQPATQMPLAPDAVMGLINLRGRVITQLDVRKVIGLPERDVDDFRVAIVETMSGEDFGLVIDEVGEVIDLDAAMYEKTPKTLDRVWQDVSEGVLKQEERVLVLVNVERFIAMTIPQTDDLDEDRVLH
ncbi:MAG: chemotaxis protein CheW [Mariprofundus sp.]|nr:chemotaxis protein CheW [Mariprofundus sp.]